MKIKVLCNASFVRNKCESFETLTSFMTNIIFVDCGAVHKVGRRRRLQFLPIIIQLIAVIVIKPVQHLLELL